MSSPNLNRTILIGNLTRDPELRAIASGTSVCSLRVACSTRRRNSANDGWDERPNYFDVTVWGAQGENCARYLSKGRPVAIDGRLEWREWETSDGHRRDAVEIVAESVQFLGAPPASAATVDADTAADADADANADGDHVAVAAGGELSF